jgi:hypothetical protein
MLQEVDGMVTTKETQVCNFLKHVCDSRMTVMMTHAVGNRHVQEVMKTLSMCAIS